jgi:UDP-glucose 4-epimerase
VTIVITGATGHIGSYLIRDLATQFPGANIIMIDNMMTQRFSSLFNLPKTAKYRFIEGDVKNLDLISIFKNVDIVVHLAAITDAAGSFGKAAEVEENNFISTLKVSEACLKTNAKLITISSTSVYGTQNDIVDEDCGDDELQPQSPYAETKLKEEKLISSFCNNDGLKAITCRFGTIFGVSPGMRFHTAVNKFCWQASMSLPITVWKTAFDQKRPYLDLIDASRAISFIIEKDIFDGKIYNILTSNSTVRDITETIKQFVPNLTIEFVENKIMNQLSYEVSCNKFKAYNFDFSGSLEKGIGETISQLKN